MIREYLWIDDTLVAVRAGYAGHAFQYVLTDPLNTPRAVVLPRTNAIVWRRELTGTAFGEHAAQADPGGDAVAYAFNLRYPGSTWTRRQGCIVDARSAALWRRVDHCRQCRQGIHGLSSLPGRPSSAHSFFERR